MCLVLDVSSPGRWEWRGSVTEGETRISPPPPQEPSAPPAPRDGQRLTPPPRPTAGTASHQLVYVRQSTVRL